ncbi:E3 ubiquitin-protein ligase RNF34-like [Dendronephthya gigantea]|uniref:E3 ubiquitin-protein ligase RNF34-like n=1 Tax=Dendronephthya gigantea TaxID=151771 RepID=UPI001069C329|nr:E3 ubiquitin-protein ligase RNF34-like [Dendronephthya gigantea]
MSGAFCVGCSMHFTLFKRKNRCIRCRLQYCSPCFKKGENLPRRNIKQCLKCHALSSQPFIRSELMLLSVKELKAFLEQRNVSSAGCTEKQDLVDVMINHQARQQVELETPNEPSVNEPSVNEPSVTEHGTNEPNATRFNQPPINSQTSSSSQQQARTQSHNSSQGLNDFFSGIHINPEIHRFVESVFQFDESGAMGLRPPSQHEIHNRNETSHDIPIYQQYTPNENFTPSCVNPNPVSTSYTFQVVKYENCT